MQLRAEVLCWCWCCCCCRAVVVRREAGALTVRRDGCMLDSQNRLCAVDVRQSARLCAWSYNVYAAQEINLQHVIADDTAVQVWL
jgi:hypothetical protein